MNIISSAEKKYRFIGYDRAGYAVVQSLEPPYQLSLWKIRDSDEAVEEVQIEEVFYEKCAGDAIREGQDGFRDHAEFMECRECGAKPGSPTLCPSCLNNRDAIHSFAALYHELLYAVAKKFPGESRHETALRYIRDAEKSANGTGSCEQNVEEEYDARRQPHF